jgi:hypothetical protein
MFGIEGEPEFGPVQGQHERHVVGVQWSVLVGESDPAVELRVAGELPFESGHADQDEADVVAVEVVAELFQALGFQPIGLVDFTAWPRQLSELPCWSGTFTLCPTCRSQLLVRLYQA